MSLVQSLQSLRHSIQKWHDWWWLDLMRNYHEAQELKIAMEGWIKTLDEIIEQNSVKEKI